MAKNTSRLGRGLSALISTTDAASQPTEAPLTTAGEISPFRMIAIESIIPNPRQPRTGFDEDALSDLASSIRDNGVLQPVVVRLAGDDRYELVAGERRWRAAKAAGLDAVPAVVRELSDSEAFCTALIENLQREDLGPLERAAAYQHYLELFGGTIEDLAARLCQSRANISNYMRLLKLRPEICYMLGTGELGMGQARAIAGIEDPQRQLAIAKLAARRNLSVRQVEALARNSEGQSAQETPTTPDVEADGRVRQVRMVEEAISKSIGLRVRMHPGKKKNSGRVVIFYNSLEEFDRIAERIGGGANLE
jgi:ParB family chromosome partitioning protein